MNWVVISLLVLGFLFKMTVSQKAPYVCDGKDDRVCDQYRCICRRKTSTEAYPRTDYEF
ncbi:uncharacterized protein LOC108111046 [Drosophila eugracilis]|uniref:uncharacterized protein LOC108111046 n=1 Tax=Drosophila eugracilis TaxID=29029 RepID=UPI0007E61433|nr:uncharacterized protein LOC108111046 [Drosophila eugracilis]